MIWRTRKELFIRSIYDKFKTYNDQVRVLKLAQAITDGNYSLERMQDLLAHKKDYTYLRSLSYFNVDVYKNQLRAEVFQDAANIKLPKELAGCIRGEIKEENGDHGRAFLAAKVEHKGGTVLNEGSTPDKITHKGREAYYVKYKDENGNIKDEEFGDMQSRDKRAAEINKDPKNTLLLKYGLDKAGYDQEKL